MYSLLIRRLIAFLNLMTVITFFSKAESVFQPPISYALRANDKTLSATSISPALFTEIERLARLVDISYCVGTSGIYRPFICASRCKDFCNLRLVSTWKTGMLLGDSCGYVAIDDGTTEEKKQGGLTDEGPAIIVAFRGTYSLANTVVDLSTIPQQYVPYPGPGDGDGNGNNSRNNGTERPTCANCTVHMGFFESWQQARKLVLPVLHNARATHPGYPVHVVGHSLGGAVALLAALEMRLVLGWEDVTVTTFGEPQAGNAGFVTFVDAVFDLAPEEKHQPQQHLGGGGDDDADLVEKKRQYRRVTHVGDPVPLLPLSEWGYRSHGGEVFITKRRLSPGLEDLRLCRGDEDPTCIAGSDDDSLGIPTRLKLWQLLVAHRDYFWRLGLCVPGGDPSDWGRAPYNVSDGHPDEL